ncbi:acyl-CoA carboxylase epsilon subunit [Streptomyces subrutilus]|uniref:acyl-CoA carboxylase epsilon subunit n=1 Tax=Streptomyces subrutilus TaxID=36818 RepID=UPI0033E0E175
MPQDAATAPIAVDAPDRTDAVEPAASVASWIRVERGTAAPEELAAIAVVVACLARRTGHGHGHSAVRSKATGPGRGGRPSGPPGGAGCWAGCWACR